MTKLLRTIVSLLVTTAFLGIAPAAFAADDKEPDGAALSMTQTSYTGARILKGTENINFESIETGPYGDENSVLYAHWQGDTLFAGAKNDNTGNKVDLVAEWFWFESSIPRNADFYVGVIKVKASPNPVDDWYLKKQGGVIYDWFWKQDYAHFLEFAMDPTGEYGGLRWDWCVPFDSYKWEPNKVTEVESGYSAGFDVQGGFSEGGILKDLTDKSNIQAKGYINGKHSVSTKYTITLYKWQMLVSSGADNVRWEMYVLPEGNNADSAYHEYFVVIQATKGTTVYVPEITFGGNYRQWLWYWLDNYDGVSATIKGLTFTPPPSCYVDDDVPADACKSKGVCSDAAGYCDPMEGVWACNYPDEFEKEELTCDGLDNDCDGKVDENFLKLGKACDGDDEDKKKNGIYVCADDEASLFCDEDPCAGKQCGDGCGECDFGFDCKNNKCVWEDDGEDGFDPQIGGGDDDGTIFDCNGVTEVGECDGAWLLYCAGGTLVEQYCAFCCGYDPAMAYYNCMPEDKCEDAEECIPDCEDKECGGDGCGGICGECAGQEACEEGMCTEVTNETESKAYTCGNCPAGWICGASGYCVEDATANRPDEFSDESGGNASCTAGPAGNGSSVFLGFLMLLSLLSLSFRLARKTR